MFKLFNNSDVVQSSCFTSYFFTRILFPIEILISVTDCRIHFKCNIKASRLFLTFSQMLLQHLCVCVCLQVNEGGWVGQKTD